MDPPAILELPRNVVHRMAAGEVVEHPICALKELLDNAVDAQSTRIDIRLSPRGFVIRDDGHGIRFEDFNLLCRRHTTSKLRSFEELSTVKTLGFRGEALSSISRVGRLTITSRPVTSSHARSAQYEDEQIIVAPAPCAGHRGTTVAIDFHPNQSATIVEETAVEMFKGYALHCSAVGFSIEFGAAMKIKVGKDDVFLDRLSKLYGIDVARHAVRIENAFLDRLPGCSVHGCGSWSEGGKRRFVLFLNDRWIRCRPMKKAVEAVYVDCLPKKMSFVYLSLRLPTGAVDVNVHPSKKEVAFLNKEKIIQGISAMIRASIQDTAFGSRRPEAVGPPSLPLLLTHPPTPFRPQLTASSSNVVQRVDAHRLVEEHDASTTESVENELKVILDGLDRNESKACRRILQGHVFIGVSCDVHAFVQFENGLYVLNMETLLHDFVAQTLWRGIGRLKKLRLEKTISMTENGERHPDDVDFGIAHPMIERPEQRELDVINKISELNGLLSIEISSNIALSAIPLPLASLNPIEHKLQSFCAKLWKLIRSWDGRLCTLGCMIDALGATYSIGRQESNAARNDASIHSEAGIHDLLQRMRTDYRPSIDRAVDGSIISVTTVDALRSKFDR